MFFTRKLERALKAIAEIRLPSIEQRLAMLEDEIAGHIRSLNTVLNGVTDVNMRLSKGKIDLKLVSAEIKKTYAYQTLVNRITGLEDEVSTWSTSITQRNLRQNALEDRIERLEHVLRIYPSPPTGLSLDETRVMDEAYEQKHRENDGKVGGGETQG